MPEIATLDVRLPTPLAAGVEEATLALRTADQEGATGPSGVALLRTESAASSKVEQIEVGQRHVGRALAGLPTKPRAAQEVANNVHALHQALEFGLRTGLSISQLHHVHAALLPDEPWSGAARTVQNWIGGSDHSPRGARYVPPEPDDVARLMADLAEFASRDDVPALAQAAIAHAQFEVIHPYRDGNGRVGRALTHMILRRRGVVINGVAPLSVAILADRTQYMEGLRTYQRGDLAHWVEWFAAASGQAAWASRELQRRLGDLQLEWSELPAVADARSDAAIRQVVAGLAEHPVCSAAQLAERIGVSRAAARNALEALRLQGVVNRTTAARNLQVYEAMEVFALVEDLERTLQRDGPT